MRARVPACILWNDALCKGYTSPVVLSRGFEDNLWLGLQIMVVPTNEELSITLQSAGLCGVAPAAKASMPKVPSVPSGISRMKSNDSGMSRMKRNDSGMSGVKSHDSLGSLAGGKVFGSHTDLTALDNEVKSNIARAKMSGMSHGGHGSMQDLTLLENGPTSSLYMNSVTGSGTLLATVAVFYRLLFKTANLGFFRAFSSEKGPGGVDNMSHTIKSIYEVQK